MAEPLSTVADTVIRAVRGALITAAVLIVLALFFGRLFGPLWKSLNVDESFSQTLAGLGVTAAAVGGLPRAWDGRTGAS
ncbi:MAG: hypothetical protein HND48_02580 [Chloroflexi bacterium]|nr:hypothetical protein [Chloroflexota bacterium]